MNSQQSEQRYSSEQWDRITIGVTTFNRAEYLEKMALSLQQSHGLEECNLRVFDDNSSELSMERLRTCFPSAKEIVRREKNLGADENIRQMFADFLTSNDDILIAVDSDLIFHPDWLRFVRQLLPLTDGIMSVYNSVLHPPRNTVKIGGNVFLEKEHIGSAGVVMRRALVQDIISNVPSSRCYDWDWSRYLRNRGIRLLVTQRSYVQHIGVGGTNNLDFYIDYGLNFISGTEFNEKLATETLQKILAFKDAAIEERNQYIASVKSKLRILFACSRAWKTLTGRNPRSSAK